LEHNAHTLAFKASIFSIANSCLLHIQHSTLHVSVTNKFRHQQARTGLDEMIEGVRKNPHLRTAVKVIGLLPRGIVWTIIDPHHPKVEKRVQKLQRYVDLCIKHACAKKVTQQRIQSLHELRGVLPD